MFSEVLREAMQEQGVGQTALADQLKVAPSTVSRWLRNETLPSEALCVRLAEALGVDLDELIYGLVKSRTERVTGRKLTAQEENQALALRVAALEEQVRWLCSQIESRASMAATRSRSRST